MLTPRFPDEGRGPAFRIATLSGYDLGPGRRRGSGLEGRYFPATISRRHALSAFSQRFAEAWMSAAVTAS